MFTRWMGLRGEKRRDHHNLEMRFCRRSKQQQKRRRKMNSNKLLIYNCQSVRNRIVSRSSNGIDWDSFICLFRVQCRRRKSSSQVVTLDPRSFNQNQKNLFHVMSRSSNPPKRRERVAGVEYFYRFYIGFYFRKYPTKRHNNQWFFVLTSPYSSSSSSKFSALFPSLSHALLRTELF